MKKENRSQEVRRDLGFVTTGFTALEPLSLPILAITPEGEIKFVNPAACDSLGHSKDELKGLSIKELFPKKRAEDWSSFWSELDQEGLKIEQTTLRLPGKKQRSVGFLSLFICEAGHKFCGFLLSEPENFSTNAVDPSVRRQLFHQVLNSLANPVIVMDEQHHVAFLNQAACQVLGTSAADAVGLTVHDFLPKRHADILWKQEQDVLDSGRPATYAGDGFLRSKYAESATMLPFSDSSTSQKRILIVLNKSVTPYSDETVPSISDESLPSPRNSAQVADLPRLVERGSIGIFLKDTDNTYLWVNHTFAQMNGHKPDELIGKRVDDLIVDSEIMGNLHREDDYVYATGQPLFNRTMPKFNDQPGYYRLDKIPFIDRKGGIVGIIGLVVEVDEAAQPIQALKDEIASASKKLMETETALRVLIERREQDVSLTREELNAKVKNLVVPYLELLKHTRLNPEQAEFVDLMETNLKNFYDPAHARLSSPTYRLSPTELKVAQFIRDGKSNKEIARLLHLSKSTILTHRHHLRVKLGIRNKKVNLRSLLNS